jgi:catechol 2,3-dioxygenase-like lactoylglutathione lyase family enzyme
VIVGLDHVQLAIPAGGEKAAREFYCGILGLSEKAKPPHLAGRGGCWFAGPGVELHVGIEEPFRPAAKAHPALLVSDLEAMRARLAEHGIKRPMAGRSMATRAATYATRSATA